MSLKLDELELIEGGKQLSARMVELGARAAEAALESSARGEEVHAPPLPEDYQDFIVAPARAAEPQVADELEKMFEHIKSQPVYRRRGVSAAFADARTVADGDLPFKATGWG